jgi:protein TonB
MSAAGRPETRRVPGPALLAGLALLAAVLAVAALLLTSRPSALPLPARAFGPNASPARRPGSPSERPGPKVHRPGAQNRSVAPRPKPAAVVIAERPTRTQPRPPSDDSAPMPAAPATPKSPRMPAENSDRQTHPSAPPEIAPPSPPSSSNDDSEADGSYTAPQPVFRVEARYPEDAAREDVTGSVRLKLILDRRGRVEDAIVVQSSGDDRLDEAAAEAVRRWRYRPARRNGRAVAAVDYATIQFYRDDSGPAEP